MGYLTAEAQLSALLAGPSPCTGPSDLQALSALTADDA